MALHIKARPQEVLSYLEERGPDRVRAMLLEGNQFSTRHTTIAEEWLHQKDQEAAAREADATKRADARDDRQANASERAAAAAERASAAAESASVAAAAQAVAAAAQAEAAARAAGAAESQAKEARRANRMAHRAMMIGIALTIANVILMAISFFIKN